jgi:PAS domain S-box-containing protein
VVNDPLIPHFVMTTKGKTPGARIIGTSLKRAAELRRKAKAIAQKKPALPTLESRRVLHKLQVHQVELEMQNEELRQSEERYRAVVEDLTEVICRFRKDGTFTFVNEAYGRFFGKTPDALLGKKWQPRVLPEDLPHIKARLRAMSPVNPVVVIENRVYSGSGEVRWMQFVNRGFFDPAGRLVETQAVGRDITERKQMEEKQRETEAAARARADELTALFTATPAITFIAHDPACRRMTSSNAALRLLRLPADANTSKSAPPGERPETFRAMKDGRELRPEELPVQRAAASGQVVNNFELTLAFADGTARDIVGDAVPLFDAEGKVRGAVGVFSDITERKRLEVESKLAEARLRDFSRKLLAVREEEKRRLSAILHHDVGSITVAVAARLDALEEELLKGGNPPALPLLVEARRMFAQAMTGLKSLAVELRPPSLDILGLPAALRQHFLQVTRDTRLKIYFTNSTAGAVIAPEVQTVLFRVAQECLTNVVKHARAHSVRVQLAALRKTLRLRIADDGQGFDPALVNRLPVTHLGLLAMQEMAASLGGQAEINSRIGGGTSVTVTIPRAGVAP